MKSKEIRTYNADEFMRRFMTSNVKLTRMMQRDFMRFFIADVQELIKISKVPVPPTRATTHTLIYLTKGVASMKIGFLKLKIREHMCLVVPAGQVFSYDQYEVNEGFICNFQSDFLVGKLGSNELVRDFDFLNIWGNPVIKVGSRRGKYLQQTFQRLLDEYAVNGMTNVDILQSYFIAALCDVNHAYKPLTNHKNKSAVNLTNRFKALVHAHITTRHLVVDYADMLHVSPNHLNKKVKEVSGIAASKWIDYVLVTEAKVLLAQTSFTVNEIATKLGIFDQSYFSRLFKKYERITPVEFRTKMQMS